jgi:predicted alpha/beta-fold hydrolase
MNETDFTFKPAWWLPGPHLQTLWPSLCRRNPAKLNLKRERVELPDGDFLDLDWIGTEGPIVMILHGLEGSVYSPYAQGMLQTFEQKGWRGLFMHFRGCSGEPNRLPRSYHSGETTDLAFIVEHIRRRERGVPIAAIGFSLGGNVLLKWLGETGAANPLVAAIAVSVPFELKKTIKRVQQGFSRIYQWHLLYCLRKRLTEKFKSYPAPLDIPEMSAIRSISDFDEKITVPLHGFRDTEEYYQVSSSRQYLSKIKVPTLLLQAEDDPFMTMDAIPELSELSDQVTLQVTKSGGHVGFVSGWVPWRAVYWLEQRVPEFFKEYLTQVEREAESECV